MKTLLLLAITAIVVGTIPAAAKHKAPQLPKAGIYSGSVQVAQADGSCLDRVGTTYPGVVVRYPGTKSNEIVVFTPIPRRGESKQVLAITRGKATIYPSGTFVWRVPGYPPLPVIAGRFSSIITIVSAKEIFANVIEVYTYGGSCRESLAIDVFYRGQAK